MADDFSQDDFCVVVIDDFLLVRFYFRSSPIIKIINLDHKQTSRISSTYQGSPKEYFLTMEQTQEMQCKVNVLYVCRLKTMKTY